MTLTVTEISAEVLDECNNNNNEVTYNLKEKLAEWATSFEVSHACLSALLAILVHVGLDIGMQSNHESKKSKNIAKNPKNDLHKECSWWFIFRCT